MFFIFVSNLVGQEKIISGVVNDSYGNPIPGVNILQETDPKKIDTSVLDDGRHYITYPTDAFIEVKDGKLVGKIDYR